MTPQDSGRSSSAVAQALLILLRAFLRAFTRARRGTAPTGTTRRERSRSAESADRRRPTGRPRATGTAAGSRAGGAPRHEPTDGYAGDATRIPALRYEPYPDGDADPGEIVWAWVPFEEDHSRGKDRPVLVIGRQDGLLLALMLSSQDHDADRADEARWGRRWVDIGSGAWDPQRRPSEVRVDRVLRLRPSAVRRQGAALDRTRFDTVAAAVHDAHA